MYNLLFEGHASEVLAVDCEYPIACCDVTRGRGCITGNGFNVDTQLPQSRKLQLTNKFYFLPYLACAHTVLNQYVITLLH